jgi:hypothetical protein
MKSGANYSESQKIAVADHHPELWGCYSLATTTTASNVWNSVALGRGYEERPVTLKIDIGSFLEICDGAGLRQLSSFSRGGEALMLMYF